MNSLFTPSELAFIDENAELIEGFPNTFRKLEMKLLDQDERVAGESPIFNSSKLCVLIGYLKFGADKLFLSIGDIDESQVSIELDIEIGKVLTTFYMEHKNFTNEKAVRESIKRDMISPAYGIPEKIAEEIATKCKLSQYLVEELNEL